MSPKAAFSTGRAMYIGIDVGTSAVKIVVIDESQAVAAATEVALAPRQPQPLWSEDDPEAWWRAVVEGMDRLAHDRALLARVRAIGLSGQMHGAVLLDAEGKPIRPAILWNDGRSTDEAQELAALGAELQDDVGVLAMPGFTGPKILWLRRHEPAAIARTRRLLLPKDFVRLRLTGEYATDCSDAAGTWLLGQAARQWSGRALKACGVDPAWLPPIVESSAESGRLRADLAERWGMSVAVPVAGGAGDVAAGSIGIGAVDVGQSFISLGTSAQLFTVDDRHAPDTPHLVHAFCHAVPGRWFRMSALLNGASPLAAVARWTGHTDIGALLGAIEAVYRGPSHLLALPYLHGERTPHNDPIARGAIVGMTASTTTIDIAQAVLEAVAFSLADGLAALGLPASANREFGFIGGGARSLFWGRLIASVLGVTLVQYDNANQGPAFGAARLARACATGEPLRSIAVAPPVCNRIEPDDRLHDLYRSRLDAFRALYAALRPIFPATV